MHIKISQLPYLYFSKRFSFTIQAAIFANKHKHKSATGLELKFSQSGFIHVILTVLMRIRKVKKSEVCVKNKIESEYWNLVCINKYPN